MRDETETHIRVDDVDDAVIKDGEIIASDHGGERGEGHSGEEGEQHEGRHRRRKVPSE